MQQGVKKKTADRQSSPTPLQAWVNANRDQLKAKFHRNFGRQMHEWPDFIEAEYLKSATT